MALHPLRILGTGCLNRTRIQALENGPGTLNCDLYRDMYFEKYYDVGEGGWLLFKIKVQGKTFKRGKGKR